MRRLRRTRRRLLLWVLEHAEPGDLLAVVDAARRRLAARLEPPEPVLDRARAAQLARLGPHPTLLRDHPNLTDPRRPGP